MKKYLFPMALVCFSLCVGFILGDIHKAAHVQAKEDVSSKPQMETISIHDGITAKFLPHEYGVWLNDFLSRDGFNVIYKDHQPYVVELRPLAAGIGSGGTSSYSLPSAN